MLDINTAKSYATLDNLNKALAKFGIADHDHLVVKNFEGRYTAVFPFSNFQRTRLFPNGMHYVGFYANKGFMTLG